ncbi:hypothetical protein DPX16_9256 [Anabarilius grahami]|uniref:Uncharacterized protein n=1 Tax=Anabarilius grahami TaxID=495550 RepID=A0A3N0Y642_ANAGA|nr:hypothetical protein DPX16_9256 [Anabarilius grahami]
MGDGDGEEQTLLDGTSRSRRDLLGGNQGKSCSSASQSISHLSSSRSTYIPTGTDVMAGSNTWSDGTSDVSSGTDETAGCGSVLGIGSGTVSMAGISWICLGLRWVLVPYLWWVWALAKGLRGGSATEVVSGMYLRKRTRIGVHLRAVMDPQRRWIADPPWLRAASAPHPRLKTYLRGGSVWDLQIDTTVTVKARARPRIRHGSAQDPLIDSRIYGAARRRSGSSGRRQNECDSHAGLAT